MAEKRNKINEETVVEEVSEPAKVIITGKVIPERLNIRQEADINSKVLMVANAGDILELDSKKKISGFYKVTTKTGVNGFAMCEFVSVE